MNVIMAVANMATLAQTAATLSAAAANIAALVQKAQAEGRTDLTAPEVEAIVGHDMQARLALADAISKALGAK